MARWPLLRLLITLLLIALANAEGDDGSDTQEGKDSDDSLDPKDGTPKFRTVSLNP